MNIKRFYEMFQDEVGEIKDILNIAIDSNIKTIVNETPHGYMPGGYHINLISRDGVEEYCDNKEISDITQEITDRIRNMGMKIAIELFYNIESVYGSSKYSKDRSFNGSVIIKNPKDYYTVCEGEYRSKFPSDHYTSKIKKLNVKIEAFKVVIRE